MLARGEERDNDYALGLTDVHDNGSKRWPLELATLARTLGSRTAVIAMSHQRLMKLGREAVGRLLISVPIYASHHLGGT